MDLAPVLTHYHVVFVLNREYIIQNPHSLRAFQGLSNLSQQERNLPPKNTRIREVGPRKRVT